MFIIYTPEFLVQTHKLLKRLNLSVDSITTTEQKVVIESLQKTNNLYGVGLITSKIKTKDKKFIVDVIVKCIAIAQASQTNVTVTLLYQDKDIIPYIKSKIKGNEYFRLYGYRYATDMLSEDNLKLELITPIIKHRTSLIKDIKSEEDNKQYSDIEIFLEELFKSIQNKDFRDLDTQGLSKAKRNLLNDVKEMYR